MLTYIRIACLTLLAFTSLAQTKGLNYQAVILDPKPLDVPGNTISNLPYGESAVCIKFSLLDKSGELEYQEVQCTKTDVYGLVNLTIGTGNSANTQVSSSTAKYGKFDTIIWDANPKKLKVDVSFDQGKTFTLVSAQALNYSAYALYAESVDYQNVRSAPTKLSQFTDDIEIVSKKDLDPLRTDINKNKSDIQSILSNNVQTSTDVAIINQSIAAIKTVNETQNGRLDYLNAQVGSNNTSIQNLSSTYERLQNRSIDTELGGPFPMDGLYPSQRAVKIYVDAQKTAPATSTVSGKITLAGDLSGTATSPTVPALALKENLSNKAIATDLGAASSSDAFYPSQKAVKTYVDNQIATGAIADATSLSKGKIQLAGDLAGTATSPTVPALALKENLSNKAVATDLGAASPSDTFYPSQKAVKTYVDNQIASGTIADATSLSKGKIQLAGDLSGTAASPEIAANSITSTKILDGTIESGDLKDASVTNSKIVGIDGLKVTGNINGNAANITASSNSTLTSLANLATVGTLTSGTWNGSTIAVANGGTGVSSLTGMVRANGTGAFTSASYGSFYDLTNQTAALADSAVAMKLNTTDFANGISVRNNSELTVTNAGIYNLEFSAQVDRSAGTTTQIIKIWLRKNGVDVPASATEMIIAGGVSTAAVVASWNFFQNLAAGDRVELMWSVSNTQIYLAYIPSTTSPRRPAVPSLIVTMNQVF